MRLVVILSAYREGAKEWRERIALASQQRGRRVTVIGAHTAHEASLALDDLRPEDDELMIVTSPGHRRRAYLTFIKALLKRGWEQRVRLTVAGGLHNPSVREAEKIAAYQVKGDVATDVERRAYEAVCATS